jgi:glycosyltransferase involved in cell wall biosynthesis
MQTYENFEVLIMDDCSPDNTPEVARSFKDPRVKHIRNEPNLGHLRNYNKGIELSQGEYIWLISADDSLRHPHALERYLQIMDDHPHVGYILCAGVGLRDHQETGILGNYYYGDRDKIFDGRRFVSRVLNTGGILSPSVMARKECYEKLAFPLDMPHQGDMYLWLMWALEYDVAYLAEPMVRYRLHDENMTKIMNLNAPMQIMKDELAVLWKTKHAASQKGFRALERQLEHSIARKYAYAVMQRTYEDMGFPYKMTVQECEESILNSAIRDEVADTRSTFYTLLADEYWWRGHFRNARHFYVLALRNRLSLPKVWVALFLTYLGNVGFGVRKAQAHMRQRLRRYSNSSGTDTVPTSA